MAIITSSHSLHQSLAKVTITLILREGGEKVGPQINRRKRNGLAIGGFHLPFTFNKLLRGIKITGHI